ncbi:MAG: hypothetical protein RLZZ341_2747, partial [Pseudomonadota bacterium]
MGRHLEPEDRAAVDVLIESLDADGYLADPLEEVAERLAAMLGLDEAEALEQLADRLRLALRLLQSLDPPGVGARSLPECLKLQLEATPRCAARQVALHIAAQHLEPLARRDYRRLAALTGSDEDTVRAAHELIRRCEPKPGRPFGGDEGQVVVPDVIVRKTGRGLSVTLNPDVMPRLRINDLYAQAARGLRGGNANPGLSSRLQEARWFVKNIQQRFDTILRVSKAIVERQKGFMQHGPIAMKPLVLREIADELGLHESTISRVTTAKYMATPQGTFELKHFFGSSLNTDAGGNASSTAVRALIQQFVSAEDAKKPLSDNQLSAMLEEQGIQVARRTVAKYRDGRPERSAGMLFLPCAGGVEALLADEAARITGGHCEAARGGVWVNAASSGESDEAAAMRLNLESRLATRVLVPLADSPYRDEHDLYALARRVDWDRWLTPADTLRVDVQAMRSPL